MQMIEKHTYIVLLSRISSKLAVNASIKLTWIDPWVGKEHRKVPKIMFNTILSKEARVTVVPYVELHLGLLLWMSIGWLKMLNSRGSLGYSCPSEILGYA
jgi:hypothetical protein